MAPDDTTSEVSRHTAAEPIPDLDVAYAPASALVGLKERDGTINSLNARC